MNWAVVALLPVCSGFGQTFNKVDVSGFESLSVNGRIDVNLIQSNQDGLELAIEGIDPEKVQVENDHGELSIKIVSTLSYKDVRVLAKVYYSHLEHIHASSSASISSGEQLVFDTLSVDLMSGGEVAFDLIADQVNMKCATGSILQLKGHLKTLTGQVKSKSTLSASELMLTDCHMQVRGKSVARIHVSGTMDVKASTWSSILYKGTPSKKKFKKVLGGSIEPLMELNP